MLSARNEGVEGPESTPAWAPLGRGGREARICPKPPLGRGPDPPTAPLPPLTLPPPLPSPPQFHPGDKVGIGKDDTLFALESGIVVFKATSSTKKVMVVPAEDFVVPEGQRVQPGSRTAKRREAYTPRAAQREAAAVAAAVAAVRPAP